MKNPKLHITWYGHSAFLLESVKGTRVLVDPWLDNPKAPSGAKEINGVRLILVTHGHGDHLGNTIEIAQRTGATVVAIHEIGLYLKKKGLQNVEGINKGGTVTIKDVSVTMVDATHSSGIDVEDPPIPGGEAAGYVIELENGYRVYHAGDTGPFGDMKLLGQMYKPDLALVPIGGVFTMGAREAAYACTLIKPKRIIGMHFGTFPALSGTPEQLRKHLPAAMKAKVLSLDVGVPTPLG